MSQERRQSFCCKAGTANAPLEGILHTRRGDVPVELQDRSSNGFGVVIPSGSKNCVNENEELAFSLGDSSSLVRVAHQSPTDEGMLVGLEVLRELPAHLINNYGKRNKPIRRSSKLIRYTTVAAGLLIVALSVPWQDALSALAGAEAAGSDADPNPAESNAGGLPPKVNASEYELAHSFIAIDQLKSEAAVTRLNLSLAQQQEISRIVKETTYSMEAIFKHRDSMSDMEWTELGLQLLQNAARRIEAALTPEQRAEWAKLSRGQCNFAEQPAEPAAP